MKLRETLKAIRDDALPLQSLEKFRDDLIHIRTDLHRLRAELKKKRALYMLSSKEETLGAKKMTWEGNEDGQRLIEVEGDLGGIGLEIDGLMSRIFSKIR